MKSVKPKIIFPVPENNITMLSQKNIPWDIIDSGEKRMVFQDFHLRFVKNVSAKLGPWNKENGRERNIRQLRWPFETLRPMTQQIF
jgi:hypothetical protein